MTQWEQLENYLQRSNVGEFNSIALAQDLRISGAQASALIQAYLEVQRRPKSPTLFVLSRRGRTSSAMWHAGQRSADVRSLTEQLLDDLAVKVNDALIPDLRRVANINPRAAHLAEALGKVFVAHLGALDAQLSSP